MEPMPDTGRAAVPAPSRRRARAAGRASGTVMLEFVLAFPLILTLMLACMQFAHIWMAKQVVHYSAFCAARAALVCHTSERKDASQQAAEQACAWISEGTTGAEPDKLIPGWGEIPGSGGVARKTRVTVEDVGRWNVKATVEHDFALIFPIVGPMIGWAVNPWESGNEWTEKRADDTGNVGDADLIRQAHIRFKEVAVLPKPYVILPEMGLPASGW